MKIFALLQIEYMETWTLISLFSLPHCLRWWVGDQSAFDCYYLKTSENHWSLPIRKCFSFEDLSSIIKRGKHFRKWLDFQQKFINLLYPLHFLLLSVHHSFYLVIKSIYGYSHGDKNCGMFLRGGWIQIQTFCLWSFNVYVEFLRPRLSSTQCQWTLYA